MHVGRLLPLAGAAFALQRFLLTVWISVDRAAEPSPGHVQLLKRGLAASTLPLDGSLSWRLSNGAGNVSLWTTLPSTALLDALDVAGEDPYLLYGEVDYAWAAMDSWRYELELPRGEWHSAVSSGLVLLRFDAIDTIATVRINDHVLGSVANQYTPHDFVIANAGLEALLSNNSSRLIVDIESGLVAARRAAATHVGLVPTLRYYNDWAEPAHRNFARKAPSDFGWDWGPAFVPAGITGDVSLIWACCGVLSSIAVRQYHGGAGGDGGGGGGGGSGAGSGNTGTGAPVNLYVDVTLAHLPPEGAAGRLVATLRAPRPVGAVVARAALRVVKEPLESSSVGEETIVLTVGLVVEQPQLWWPRGLGPQSLYSLSVSWQPDAPAAGGDSPGNEYGEGAASPLMVNRRIGLRTIELIRSALNCGSNYSGGGGDSGEGGSGQGGSGADRMGGSGSPVVDESFYFRVNGVPVFIKGANWVPSDAFTTRTTPESLRWLLWSAAAANMNMIRVWGGGPRQPDSFYDACDELGLLVWQELPYACSLYPAEPLVLTAAAEEAVSIVRQLQSHACVAVWGGNNEVEQSMAWFNESRAGAGQAHYREEYTKLFVDTLRPAVLAADPSGRPYLDSSPSNGGDVSERDLRGCGGGSEIGDVGTGGGGGGGCCGGSEFGGGTSGGGSAEDVKSRFGTFVKRWGDPNDLRQGDMHFYAYDADCEAESLYPPARFVSEHGVQSLPSAAAMAEAGAPVDRDDAAAAAAAAELLRFRQRHEEGDQEIAAQMARHFGAERLPTKLSAYLHLSQVQQGRCLRTAIAAWRRSWDGALAAADSRNTGSKCGDVGSGGGPGATAGILFWQLNDVWQGPSWSTLEYGGRWKASHYAVARAFSRLLVSAAPAASSEAALEADSGAATNAGPKAAPEAALESAPGAVSEAGPIAAPEAAPEAPMAVRITSDAAGVAAGSVKASLWPWSVASCEPLREWSAEYALPGPGTREVLRIDASEVGAALNLAGAAGSGAATMLHIEALGDDGARSFAIVEVPGGGGGTGGSGNSGSFWSGGLAAPVLPDPGIRAVASAATADGGVRLILRAALPAAHVWLSLEGEANALRGTFSDNDFAMLPCRDYTVVFEGRDGPTEQAVVLAALRITSLQDFLSEKQSTGAAAQGPAAGAAVAA